MSINPYDLYPAPNRPDEGNTAAAVVVCAALVLIVALVIYGVWSGLS